MKQSILMTSAFFAMAALVITGCATTPAGRISAAQEQFDAFPEEVQANIREGRVKIGYTKDMVRMALGILSVGITAPPDKIRIVLRASPPYVPGGTDMHRLLMRSAAAAVFSTLLETGCATTPARRARDMPDMLEALSPDAREPRDWWPSRGPRVRAPMC